MKFACSECGAPSTQRRCSRHRPPTPRNPTGGWSPGRDRTIQARFRRAVLKAADHQCQAITHGQRCPIYGDQHLIAHHTQPGNDDPTTGLALCRPHHKIIDPHAR